MTVMEPCKHCDHTDWCAKRGCTFWNDDSRDAYDELRRRAKQRNDEIDAIEEWLVDPNEWRS